MFCSKCGEEHNPDDMELGFDQPDVFFDIPKDERITRTQCNDDYCVIDHKHFYIRGILEIARTDSPQTFAFGMWAKVSQSSYKRYLELWEDQAQAQEPPFPGELANQLPNYPKSVGLKVKVQMVSPTARPTFRLINKNHPLAKEQLQGINGARILEILSPYIH